MAGTTEGSDVAASLKFGTSGLRGLAQDLVGREARRYTAGFLAHLGQQGLLGPGPVLLGRDRRASSPQIAEDCAVAVAAAGRQPIECGCLPTPALALQAMALGCPAIMITGSHIPADRNGLKFYTPRGEITKADEEGILAALPVQGPEATGPVAMADGNPQAGDRYRQRYRGLLEAGSLGGWRLGVFEHASVAADILVSLLTRAGAEVVRIGRSADFVAVDTEAVADPVFAERHDWIRSHRLDGIVSTDGDGDRPLVIDDTGDFLRGDALGLVAARFVGADVVVTPVTSNSALETQGGFDRVIRTRVGSPQVIAGMEEAAATGIVVGFEANGGVLLGSDAAVAGRRLVALPTRDAVLPILAVLSAARQAGEGLAALAAGLGLRPALADRLAEVAPERAARLLAQLGEDEAAARQYFAELGPVAAITTIDGPRTTLEGGDIIHYRASGNAPELRCYVEAATPERAAELLAWGLAAAARVVR